MKFLLTGDWHVIHKRPKNRVDNYIETIERKIDFIFDLAEEEEVVAILQPGDFWDHYSVPLWLLRHWIRRLKERGVKINTIPGQHDMKYHSSDIDNTPMGVLDASEVISMVGTIPYIYPTEDVMIYGCGWDSEIPKVKDKSATNILLIHKLIVPSRESRPYNKRGIEHTPVRDLIKFKDYDLIVSGDNHKSFTWTNKSGDRHLINCGSLLRSNIDQNRHKPVVYIYDSDKKEIVDKHFIPIAPFSEVMNLAGAQEEKDKNEELEAFVEGLSEGGNSLLQELDFKKNMDIFIKENEGKLTKGTIALINEAISCQT